MTPSHIQPAVELQQVSCVFETAGRKVHAVDRVDLRIEPGEFFTLLGPSGSGKTTCLRMIGGFQLPSRGAIRIEGEDVSQRPPFLRPVNTVFQDYALFPHMNILENVAYGLMVRGVDRARREKRALAMLEMVQLPEIGARKPAQLSGGQRQRVALARCLVTQPSLESASRALTRASRPSRAPGVLLSIEAIVQIPAAPCGNGRIATIR